MFDNVPDVTSAEARSGAATGMSDPCPHAWQAWREGMVKEAAYYRFLHRGGGAGGELDDWLAAEHDVDAFMFMPTG